MTTIKQFWLPIVLALLAFAVIGLAVKIFAFPTISGEEKKVLIQDHMILNNIIPFLSANVDNGRLLPKQ